LVTSPFRVLFVSGQDGGTRRYRCDQPREQLEQQGIATGFREASDLRLVIDALDYDVFILHRVPYSHLIGHILNWAHQRGKIAIFETDDLVFKREVVGYDGYYRNLPPVEARHYLHKVEGHRQTLDRCDYALTTTGYLAQALQQHGKQVFINRNALGSEFVRFAEEARQHPVGKADGRIVLGYISGSVSHNQDFAAITEALLNVMSKHPQVELLIIGLLDLDKRLEPVRSRIRTIPLIPWQNVPRESRVIDINLAPLEIDNPFCQSKSEVKYFEAGILGIPTIAARTEAFEFAIHHGETGFLAGDTREWIAALESLIDHAGLRKTIGEAARRDVLRNYLPDVRGKQFAQLLSDLVAQPSTRADTVSTQEQVEYQIMSYVAGILEELMTPYTPSDLPRPYDDTLWRRRYLFERLEEAHEALGRTRRADGAQTGWHEASIGIDRRYRKEHGT